MENKKLVDFEQLSNFIENIVQYIKIDDTPEIIDECDNINLFMEMMAKSGSFAHKAHKELKSLKALNDGEHSTHEAMVSLGWENDNPPNFYGTIIPTDDEKNKMLSDLDEFVQDNSEHAALGFESKEEMIAHDKALGWESDKSITSTEEDGHQLMLETIEQAQSNPEWVVDSDIMDAYYSKSNWYRLDVNGGRTFHQAMNHSDPFSKRALLKGCGVNCKLLGQKITFYLHNVQMHSDEIINCIAVKID